MYQLSTKTEKLIKKTIRGKKYLKLNIGVMIGGKSIIKTFDENGEIDYENNVYEIGSITKVFTASLLAKYIEQNKIRLDDSINKFIPELEQNKYYPSIQRIATHSAGISSAYPLSNMEYYRLMINVILGNGKIKRENIINFNYKKMIELIKKTKLTDKEYKWQYSNFGMALLGYAIGSVTGNGYWSEMEDFLANELGLKNSYLGTVNNKNINGFNSKNENCGNWEWEKNGLMIPAGGISSTAEDLLTYSKMNMYEEKDYLAFCHKQYSGRFKDIRTGFKNYDMGLAWWLDNRNNNIIVHPGSTGCFESYLGIDKDKKIGVVLLSIGHFKIRNFIVRRCTK